MRSSEFRWQELKRRKIVQWALAYLAGAWLLAEVAGHLADTWSLPDILIQGLHVVLAFGLVATLVIAWYHGEQGRQRVSGPELLMLAGILLVGGVAVAALGRNSASEAVEPRLPETGADPDSPPPSVSPRSIAVVPFENHSPNPGDAYLAGAMADEIAGALKKVPGLRVSLASSTRRFDRSEMTPSEFAATRLGTAYAVDGSVQAHEERIRVTVKLLDARSGELRWSEPYDVARDTVRDILDLQVDVAQRISDELATTLTEEQTERMVSDWTDDPVAYELYLEASSHDGGTLEDYQARIPLLEEAVARDSSFAWAYFLMGDAHYQVAIRQTRTGGAESSQDDARSLLDDRAFLGRAIATAEDPVLRSNLRAFELLLDGKGEEALALSRRNVLENPNDPMSLEFLRSAYWAAGRVVEMHEVERKLLALDPLNARRRYGAGSMYLGLGMDSLAEAQFGQAVRLGDERGWEGLLDVHLFRGDAAAARRVVDSIRAAGVPWSEIAAFKERAWAGDIDGARAVLPTIDEQQLRDRIWKDAPLIAHVSLLAGDTARTDEVLSAAAAVTETAWASRSWLPGTFAVRGDAPGAAGAMREAMERGVHRARWIDADPVYARVRGHPEFESALVEVESLIDRQSRQIERQLAEVR